ncbi:MAG: uracil-DNA glycosylase [Verrucomicrobia bacterium]|nr:uracil-DNA glycosylase [Verrucomicrobiota bacterium]
MSDLYCQLLDATIQHLDQLKARGVKHVAVAPETLAALAAVPRTAPVINRAAIAVSPVAPAPPLPAPSRPAPVPVPPAPPITAHPARLTPPSPRSAHAAPIVLPDAGSMELTFQPKAGPLSPEAKTAAMAELRARALACVKCPRLAGSRKNVVFGVGDIHSPLMFVGEAPGADEDEQGEPFVGKAGQLLTRIIQTMGFTRDSVYIANILKCRPDTPGQSSGNRKPTPEEMKTCLPYLLEQIDLIRPRLLVALGATAMEGLFGRPVPITKMRGHWQTFREIPVMPTYHPAYLLRNQSLAVKREVWEDMLAVLERLGRPISEKQRNYFRRA